MTSLRRPPSTRASALAVATAVALAAISASGPARANAALAKKNNCLACHAVESKLVGPAYRDVAAKYAGQPDAVETLVASIRNGGVGKWGELPMPPQSQLSPADAKKLATWILGGAK